MYIEYKYTQTLILHTIRIYYIISQLKLQPLSPGNQIAICVRKVVELKTEAELGLKLQEDHHRITEAEIKKDCHLFSKNSIIRGYDLAGSACFKDGEEGSRSGLTLSFIPKKAKELWSYFECSVLYTRAFT